MLTDEYRGEGKDFGPAVPVPEDAPALDRLLGFSGRDRGGRPDVTSANDKPEKEIYLRNIVLTEVGAVLLSDLPFWPECFSGAEVGAGF